MFYAALIRCARLFFAAIPFFAYAAEPPDTVTDPIPPWDYYQILDVDRNAPLFAIEERFHHLDAETRLRPEILLAYAVVGDGDNRKAYDRGRPVQDPRLTTYDYLLYWTQFDTRNTRADQPTTFFDHLTPPQPAVPPTAEQRKTNQERHLLAITQVLREKGDTVLNSKLNLARAMGVPFSARLDHAQTPADGPYLELFLPLVNSPEKLHEFIGGVLASPIDTRQPTAAFTRQAMDLILKARSRVTAVREVDLNHLLAKFVTDEAKASSSAVRRINRLRRQMGGTEDTVAPITDQSAWRAERVLEYFDAVGLEPPDEMLRAMAAEPSFTAPYNDLQLWAKRQLAARASRRPGFLAAILRWCASKAHQ